MKFLPGEEFLPGWESLLWIVYVPGYSVDYFHKNSEPNISVVIQTLFQAI